MLNVVSKNLLFNNNINYQDLFNILSDIFEKKVDYTDLYFQSKLKESWILEDRIIKNGIYLFDQGIGIRTIKRNTTFFSYVDTINLEGLKNSADIIINTLKNPSYKKIYNFSPEKIKKRYPSENPIDQKNTNEKIEILYYIDKIARKIDRRVTKVNAVLTGIHEEVLISSSSGVLVSDIRPLIHLSITILVEENGNREKGYSGGGSRGNYDFFLEKDTLGNNRVFNWIHEAVNSALINLSAKLAPAGSLPVVLGSGWPGVLLHEAVGHGLEGDFNRKGTSVFSKKIGKKVASKLCTVIDDATLLNLRGSLSVDDEGVPGQSNILIKDGVLKKYMLDKFNAQLMGLESTGNGRRESYSHLPMPRMTNTYMLPGTSEPDDIINSVDYGVYAKNFSGGQVDITSGKFVFSTSEAYLIKKGKIKEAIKGAMIIGSGIEVMQSISMVGNDLKMDSGTGTCSKDGQNIPVGVGLPTIKIKKLTIGGIN
ncbi:metalloprotease TldD [Buchnera aphidicola (Mindarus keteleerifoliae)]|uniref:metalloprotease TldD n=1 Tax=Buchnera aphidicola TaxID=9 RepID=UPI0031B6876D